VWGVGVVGLGVLGIELPLAELYTAVELPPDEPED
jgi:hypothetical protein